MTIADTEQERADRLAYLVALEIATIVEDLEIRQAFLIDIWGRHRDRGPFLDTIYSRYQTLGFDDLALFGTDASTRISAFYRELTELRFYFQFTEDMPTSLSDAYTYQLARLQAFAEQAVDSLGGVPEAPVIVVPDVPTPSTADERPLLALEHFDEPEEPTAADTPDAP